tara:strand:- start:8442 stop:9128 length:687 start_codon:yes stop_codon:yes gene_type:complete
MLQAIIFDFDGVIADSEPLHYAAFQHVLAKEHILLTETEYYTDYIGMDDKGCFTTLLTRHHRTPSSAIIANLIQKKSIYFHQHVTQHLCLFDGVVDFVFMLAKRWPLAIVSGALRNEIELILGKAGLLDSFHTIISAEDVTEGKPDPEGFLKGLGALNRLTMRPTVQAKECLVIEDSIPGINGAHAAGMRCLAVTNTYSFNDLAHADAITDSLEKYDINALEEKLWSI